jgi:flagella basal body P-ring formation protein FlgA
MINRIITIALFLAASCVMRASLEDVLAPLPAVVVVSAVEKPIESQADSRESTMARSQDSRSVEFNQSSNVPVTTESDFVSFPITREDLLNAIEEEVQRSVRPVGEVSLSPLRSLPNLLEYSQPFNVRVSGIPVRLSRSSTMNLNIQVENDEGVVGNWAMTFRPHLVSEAWFPTGHLRKGDLGTESDFEIRRVDLLLEPDAVNANLDVLRKHEYSRDLHPGNPLKWSDLNERSLVRKGQVVEVNAHQGMIAISMRARAQEDGVLGDVVFLRNLDSTKDFSGEVTGEGRVQVTF